VISLDFELMWGVRDKRSVFSYGEHIKGVHVVLPSLLESFKAYGIKATFATVGFLFAEDKEELMAILPKLKPGYTNNNLSPYNGYLNEIGQNEKDDPFHFAFSLLKLIQQYPEHEISTHTFSHYYCLENGQNTEEFEADLEAAYLAAQKIGVNFKSIVFPRNQYNFKYLKVCEKFGILAFRGNEEFAVFDHKSVHDDKLTNRLFRLLDAYINVYGHHIYSDEYIKKFQPYNIPSSRLLRYFHPKLAFLDALKLKRIKDSMTVAAKTGKTYHLWWHPHNFGIHQDQHMAYLNDILNHFQKLKREYGFQSMTMADLAYSFPRKDKKILLLGAHSFSTRVMYNFLQKEFGLDQVILEKKENIWFFIKRRVRRLGWRTVLGQLIFQGLMIKYLIAISKERKQEIIAEHGLDESKIPQEKVFYVNSVNDPTTIQIIKSIAPDVIVINGTRILSKKFLEEMECPVINTHAGITPKYRGVHGAYWALVHGDKSNCGVTVHMVDKGIDTGDIFAQQIIHPLPKDNFATYTILQLAAGTRLMKKAIVKGLMGDITTTKASGESKLYYHPTIWDYYKNYFIKGVK